MSILGYVLQPIFGQAAQSSPHISVHSSPSHQSVHSSPAQNAVEDLSTPSPAPATAQNPTVDLSTPSPEPATAQNTTIDLRTPTTVRSSPASSRKGQGKKIKSK